MNIGKQLARLNRGRFFLNFGIFFFTGMIFLGDYFPNIDQKITTGVSIFTGSIGTWVVGYLDEKYGFWKDQMEHVTRINPFFSKMKSDLREIKEGLNE